MGQTFSSKTPDVRIILQGLDAAGKTTILYKLKLGEVVTTVATIGFNVETVSVNNIEMTCFDVGGRCPMRPLWPHYYQHSNALIFVIDSNDRDRLESAKDELHRALEDEQLQGLPTLVFCNKQDLPNAMSVQEVIDGLDLSSLRQKQWFAQGSCATTGDGLHEGLDWVTKAVSKINDEDSKKEPKAKIYEFDIKKTAGKNDSGPVKEGAYSRVLSLVKRVF